MSIKPYDFGATVPVRTVANTSRNPARPQENADNRKPVPRALPAITSPQPGNSHVIERVQAVKHIGGVPPRAHQAGVDRIGRRRDDPPEGTGAGTVQPGGVKVR